jgi:hypothetical protein
VELRVYLFRLDGFGRADVGAGPTVGTYVGVDAIDVSFGDRSYGTLVDAGSAGNTVVSDYVCHCLFILSLNSGAKVRHVCRISIGKVGKNAYLRVV